MININSKRILLATLFSMTFFGSSALMLAENGSEKNSNLAAIRGAAIGSVSTIIAACAAQSLYYKNKDLLQACLGFSGIGFSSYLIYNLHGEERGRTDLQETTNDTSGFRSQSAKGEQVSSAAQFRQKTLIKLYCIPAVIGISLIAKPLWTFISN